MIHLFNRLAAAATLLAASPALAQLAAPPLTPPMAGIAEPQENPVLQNDLVVKAGSDRIFFAGNDHAVPAPSRPLLMAQARWLLANPSVRLMIEGHADDRDTRDHAIALGERRATSVRNYLVSLGVAPSRLTVTSWGKERPAVPVPGYPASGVSARVVLVVVR